MKYGLYKNGELMETYENDLKYLIDLKKYWNRFWKNALITSIPPTYKIKGVNYVK